MPDPQAAKLLNQREIGRAVVRHDAVPELVKLVEDDKLAVSTAGSLAKAKPERQRRMASKIESGQRA